MDEIIPFFTSNWETQIVTKMCGPAARLALVW